MRDLEGVQQLGDRVGDLAGPVDRHVRVLGRLVALAHLEWVKAWRPSEWNHLRARIEGTVPHITVWINGTMITDWTDTANHAAGGAVNGAIGLQVHGGSRWLRGGRIRFRNITVRELG